MALLSYGFEPLQFERLVALAMPENLKSLAPVVLVRGIKKYAQPGVRALYQIRLIAHDLAALTPPPAPLSQAWERGRG
ncbi:hypothetical protein [Chroococcidiopsis sp. CCMEE 29]|uniref:hypothetical protein n=1 Tax=Chroococcidiopsis sp. CCMEE 29 TaxID=155894 RepID=UPI00202077C0|nr:hypothetical protein [Chroococcidiopsis sp. CCMEE 29]